MLPLEVQLEQVASSQDNLLALIPKLDEISEVAEMLVESPNEDAKGSDASEAVNGLQSQVVDLSQRFSAVLNQCDERKNDILVRHFLQYWFHANNNFIKNKLTWTWKLVEVS